MVCRGHCFGNGLIMRAVGDRMIVAPPLVITRAQIDEMVALIRRCLDLTLADVRRNGWLQQRNRARCGVASGANSQVKRERRP